jgi:hypothetical protein
MWWQRGRGRAQPSLDGGWVGRLEFQVLSPSGQQLGTIAMLLELDTMEVRFSERSLGLFRREDVRAWVASPTQPLTGDSCVLKIHRRSLTIALGCATPDHVPRKITEQLYAALGAA